MTSTINRRTVIACVAGLFAGGALGPVAAFARPVRNMTVFASPSCGCCKVWVEHVEANGYTAEVEYLSMAPLNQKKVEAGLTPELSSCHTALIDGYVIEGHVPAVEIDRLLAERPDAFGLTVPGMPQDAPGMGSGDTPFDVLLAKVDGTTEIFARYPQS